MNKANITVDDYFQRLFRLLDLEAEAEKQENLRSFQRRTLSSAEASGYTLTNLVIRDEAGGLGGRILLTLGKRNQTLTLPWTRLSNGSPVLLSEECPPANSANAWRGVVSRVYKDSIQVAFPQWPETETVRPSFRLDRASDEISRQRQRQAMDNARLASNSRISHLRDVLLGIQPPVFKPVATPCWINKSLNESQQEAVHFALSADDVAIIHGPPGTGKTTTLVELIRQIVQNGQRVLAVAPSNLAVDNVFEKLLTAGENAIRLGHPARVLPELRNHTLDLLVENHPDMKVVQKLMREAYTLRGEASKYSRARPEQGARRTMRQEAKLALADARKIETRVIERVLNSASVVCATMTGFDSDLLNGQNFDWCIVDEASQSTEAGTWAPLQFSDRLVLAGDHFQLPPTIISSEASEQGLGTSLLERLMDQMGKNVSRRLEVQYRMHRDIMSFSSAEFYENSLSAHSTVENHLLRDLQGVASNDLTSASIHFIDTAGASYDETIEPDGESRLNAQEAQIVINKVAELLETGVTANNIAVISPYSAQVRWLREHITQPEIEVDSVDGFQGQEKEAVIISLVRSNRENQIGFLQDVRRMNVALTRARRKLIVIGDSATITSHPFYQRMVDHFEAIGAYHSVWEEDG